MLNAEASTVPWRSVVGYVFLFNHVGYATIFSYHKVCCRRLVWRQMLLGEEIDGPLEVTLGCVDDNLVYRLRGRTMRADLLIRAG